VCLSVLIFYLNYIEFRIFDLTELDFGVGTILALGALTIWHGKLINRGETSIEANINKKERERLAKFRKVKFIHILSCFLFVTYSKLIVEMRQFFFFQTYVNPYDFGKKRNWMLFLGLVNGRSVP